jgi:hypothetical protein
MIERTYIYTIVQLTAAYIYRNGKAIDYETIEYTHIYIYALSTFCKLGRDSPMSKNYSQPRFPTQSLTG